MKLHVVFSLNVTGSFVNDIFRVVRSIRYRLYGLSLGKDIKNIVQQIQHFWPKYTSQRVLNQILGGGGL